MTIVIKLLAFILFIPWSSNLLAQSELEILRSKAKECEQLRDYKCQFKLLVQINRLTKDSTARSLYFLTDAGIKAGEYAKADSIASVYLDKFPDQAQPYFFKCKIAMLNDPDTSTGYAIPAINKFNDYLKRDIAKNKNRIVHNLGYKLYYYAKTRNYNLALQCVNEILQIDPENEYANTVKPQLQSLSEIRKV